MVVDSLSLRKHLYNLYIVVTWSIVDIQPIIQPDTEREDRRTGTLVIPCFESNQKHPRTINELMVWAPTGCGGHLKHDQQIGGSGETGQGRMCKWLANRVKEINKYYADER